VFSVSHFSRLRLALQIGRGGVLVIPQGNFLTEGTLRDQIIYPNRYKPSTTAGAPGTANGEPVDDKALLGILEEVGLKYIADRFTLDGVAEWEDALSGGECQRLGFARLLYHRPK
jgi:ATP-binding cassette subfamily D (ALD) long-chain fatty acid import protein